MIPQSLLAMYPTQNTHSKGHARTRAYSSNQDREEPECPWTDDWAERVWSTQTTDYDAAIRKNEILPSAVM